MLPDAAEFAPRTTLDVTNVPTVFISCKVFRVLLNDNTYPFAVFEEPLDWLTNSPVVKLPVLLFNVKVVILG